MKRSTLAILAALLLLLAAGSASADYMGNFQLHEPSPSYLPHGARARLTYDYKVDGPDGARFIVTPFSGGDVEPGFGWGGSPTFYGEGTHTSWLTFGSGDHHVDQYHIRMVNPETSETILVVYLHVDYTWGAEGVHNIQMSYADGSRVMLGRTLEINFDYGTDEVDGVRIYARPYHDGVLCPGYSASSSEVLPYPEGSGSQWFRFNEFEADVDAVHFRVWDHTSEFLLDEFVVPVDLHWRPAGAVNIDITPGSPQILPYGHHVAVSVTYQTDNPGGVYIHALAARDGESIPGQNSAPSPPYYGPEGTADCWFTFHEGHPEQVSQIRIFVKNVGETEPIVEFFLDADYEFGPHAVYDLQYTPRPPAALTHDERTYVDFTYTTSNPGGVYIHQWPFHNGELIGDGAASGSPNYPMGTGTGQNHFRVAHGEYRVDSLRSRVFDENNEVLLALFYHPAMHFYGGTAVVTPIEEIPDLGAAMLGQNFPNPFNPITHIPVTVAETQWLRLRLYDLRGRLVATLAEGIYGAGRHDIPFAAGEGVASGTYFYVLEDPHGRQTKSMVLVK